jgi:hypothetical protein
VNPNPDSLVSVVLNDGTIRTERAQSLRQQQPRTDDCFAVAMNSLAAYSRALGLDILGLHASDIEPKPFQPIVTGWVDHVHDAVGGAE